jgi:transmembrane sensor
MKASERVVTRVIEEQARAWLISNRESGLSPESRAEFLAWLQASPMHVCAYLAIAKVAAELQSVSQAFDTPVEQLIEMARDEQDDNVAAMVPWESKLAEDTRAEAARPRDHCMPRWPLAIAASVAAVTLTVMSWWFFAQASAPREYFTEHGEQRVVRLDDGSVLHLNSDSDVSVFYTKATRDIVMKQGQALFKVSEDKARPFRVRVGTTEVVAVGTDFDVRRMGDDVLVTVVQGSVAVMKLAVAASIESGAAQKPVSLRLAAGQQARLADGPLSTSPRNFAVQTVDVRPVVAWVEQKIMFEHETLQNVAAEFNRYGSTQLIIEDAQIATVRISGVFHAYDLESFVLYLETLRGFRVQRDVDLIRISLASKAEDAV